MDTVNVIAIYKMLSGQDASGIMLLNTFGCAKWDFGLRNILYGPERLNIQKDNR